MISHTNNILMMIIFKNYFIFCVINLIIQFL